MAEQDDDCDPWNLEAIEKHNTPKGDGAAVLSVRVIEDAGALDNQFGVDAPKTVPDALHEPLFGQPDLTGEDFGKSGGYPTVIAPMKAYAILDAAKMPYLLTGMMDAAGLQFQSLFEGWHNIVFKNESKPVKPGSILAISATYADATGHVGIVSYPKNDIAGAFVRKSGPVLPVPVLMQGQTISAAGDRVRHNNWGFRSSASPEKNSLNSPRSGIEVRK